MTGVGEGALARDIAVDAAIIGGGYTGLSAALHLAQAGATICLLEAETVGFGGSGRNVGLVNAGLWLPPEKVEAALGREAGARLNDMLAAGPDLVFALIEAHGIACQATRAGTLHCAHSRGGLAGLEDRLRQYRARNWPVRLLTPEETAARTGTDAYCGALLDSRAGTIWPLAYAQGLARAAMAAGVQLFEHSTAKAVAREKGGWRIDMAGGRVRAGALLLATNAYHIDLPGVPAPRYTPIHYFQIATTPLSENLRAAILPERQGAWDTATVMSSFRMDEAGRLIVGGMGSLESAGRSLHRGWARRKLASLFPAAADQPLQEAWEGRIAMTADHIPRIVALGERAISIYGYNGRGIAPGTVFGKAAAAYLAGDDQAVLPLAPVARHAEPMAGAKAAFYEFGAAAFHLVDCR